MTEHTKLQLVILTSSFFALLLGPTMNYATGVFYVAILEVFEEHVVMTAWVGSVFSCMFALTAPFASFIINMFDCRTCVVLAGVLLVTGFGTSYLVTDLRALFVTYSLIAGFGTGLGATGAVVILGFYFPKNTSIASGLSISGAGFGMFILPPLVGYLKETYGLHGCFLLTGGVAFHTCIFGMLMRPSAFERSRQQHVCNRRTFCADLPRCRNLLRNVSFLAYVAAVFCFGVASCTVFLFLPDFVVHHGSSYQEASFVISVSGIGSLISRIFTGIAAGEEKIGSAVLFCGLNGVAGVITLFLPWFSTNSALRNLYGLLLGLYTGGVWVLLNSWTFNILGLEDYASGIGVVMLSCGIGHLIGPPIAGTIFSSSGYYFSVFILVAIMFLCATICGFMSMMSNTSTPTSQLKDEDITDRTVSAEHVKEIPEIGRLMNEPHSVRYTSAEDISAA